MKTAALGLSADSVIQAEKNLLNSRPQPDMMEIRLLDGPLNNRVFKVPTKIATGQHFEAVRRTRYETGRHPRHHWLPLGNDLKPNPYARNMHLIDGCVPTRMCRYLIIVICMDYQNGRDYLFYGSYVGELSLKAASRQKTDISSQDAAQRIFEQDLVRILGTSLDCRETVRRTFNKTSQYDDDDVIYRYVNGPLNNKTRRGRDPKLDPRDVNYTLRTLPVLSSKVSFLLPKGQTIDYAVSVKFGP